MDFNSETEQPIEKDNDQEYRTRENTTRLEAEKDADDQVLKKWFMGMKKKNTDHESKAGGSSPSRFKSSKRKRNWRCFG